MDKVEYREIVRDIKNSYLQKDYESVISISNELELDKVKENSVLEMVSRAYESVGRYDIARDVLLIAYRRTPSGKRLAYNLAILCIKLDDLDNAVMFYEEFCKMAPKDNKRYILKYEIGKAGGVPIKDLIRVLEVYNSKEMDEKWQYELATLFNEINNREKCVAALDQLLLWYSHGEYEQRALEMKKKYKALTEEQEERLDELRSLEGDEFEEEYDDEEQEEPVIQQIEPVGDLKEFNSQEDVAEELGEIDYATKHLRPVGEIAEEDSEEENIDGQMSLENLYATCSRKLSKNKEQSAEVEASRLEYILNQVNVSHDSSALKKFENDEENETVDQVIEPEVPLLEREDNVEIVDDGGVDLYNPIPEFEFEKKAAGITEKEPEEEAEKIEESLDATQFISRSAIAAAVAKFEREEQDVLEVEPSVVANNDVYAEIDPGSARGRVAVGSNSEDIPNKTDITMPEAYEEATEESVEESAEIPTETPAEEPAEVSEEVSADVSAEPEAPAFELDIPVTFKKPDAKFNIPVKKKVEEPAFDLDIPVTFNKPDAVFNTASKPRVKSKAVHVEKEPAPAVQRTRSKAKAAGKAKPSVPKINFKEKAAAVMGGIAAAAVTAKDKAKSKMHKEEPYLEDDYLYEDEYYDGYEEAEGIDNYENLEELEMAEEAIEAEPVEEIIEEAAVEPVEEIAEEAAVESVEETAEEAAVESVKEIAEEAVVEPVEEIIEDEAAELEIEEIEEDFPDFDAFIAEMGMDVEEEISEENFEEIQEESSVKKAISKKASGMKSLAKKFDLKKLVDLKKPEKKKEELVEVEEAAEEIEAEIVEAPIEETEIAEAEEEAPVEEAEIEAPVEEAIEAPVEKKAVSKTKTAKTTKTSKATKAEKVDQGEKKDSFSPTKKLTAAKAATAATVATAVTAATAAKETIAAKAKDIKVSRKNKENKFFDKVKSIIPARKVIDDWDDLDDWSGLDEFEEEGIVIGLGEKAAAEPAAVEETSAVEAPVVEAPAVETPVVEAPVVEETPEIPSEELEEIVEEAKPEVKVLSIEPEVDEEGESVTEEVQEEEEPVAEAIQETEEPAVETVEEVHVPSIDETIVDPAAAAIAAFEASKVEATTQISIDDLFGEMSDDDEKDDEFDLDAFIDSSDEGTREIEFNLDDFISKTAAMAPVDAAAVAIAAFEAKKAEATTKISIDDLFAEMNNEAPAAPFDPAAAAIAAFEAKKAEATTKISIDDLFAEMNNTVPAAPFDPAAAAIAAFEAKKAEATTKIDINALFGMNEDTESSDEVCPLNEEVEMNIEETFDLESFIADEISALDEKAEETVTKELAAETTITEEAIVTEEPEEGQFNLDDFLGMVEAEAAAEEAVAEEVTEEKALMEEVEEPKLDDFINPGPEVIAATEELNNQKFELNEEQRQELAEFLLVDGMEEKIVAVIESLIANKRKGDKTGGNLVVVGDAKSGKTFLTIAVLKAVNEVVGYGNAQVAKVQASAINGKNIIKVLSRVSNADLIIENIGKLDSETFSDLVEAMKENTAPTMIILEGNALAIANIINNYPEFEMIFKNRIDIEELSLKEWAGIAREYAKERGYAINDMARLALHAKISESNTPNIRLGYDIICEIIDKAIIKCNRRNNSKIFTKTKKDGELIELLEADFI